MKQFPDYMIETETLISLKKIVDSILKNKEISESEKTLIYDVIVTAGIMGAYGFLHNDIVAINKKISN